MKKSINALLIFSLLMPSLAWTHGEHNDPPREKATAVSSIRQAGVKAGVEISVRSLRSELEERSKKYRPRRMAGSKNNSAPVEHTSHAPSDPHNEKCKQQSLVGSPENVAGMVMPADRTTQSCFQERRKAPVNGVEDILTDIPSEYVISDQLTCICLQGTMEGKYLESSESEKIKSKEEQAVDLFLANVKEKQERIHQMAEGMVVQAMLLAKDPEAEAAFMTKYKEKLGEESKLHLEDYKRRVVESAGPEVKANTTLFNQIKAAAEGIKPPPAELSNKSFPADTPPEPNGCFSMRAYMAFQQIPSEGEFYEDLSAMNSYSDKDWNLSVLRRDYDQAYRANQEKLKAGQRDDALQAQVNSIAARLNFLKRNPMFANLFNARTSDPAKTSKLEEKKGELFKVLKSNFAGQANCHKVPYGCVKSFTANHEKYDKEVKDIFNDLDVVEFTRATLNRDIMGEYSDPRQMYQTTAPKDQMVLEDKFKQMTGLSISGCAGAISLQDLGQCARSFPKYCRMIENFYPEGSSDEFSTKPHDILEKQAQLDVNFDPEKNEGFKELSKQLCERKGADGKTISFRDYRTQKCNFVAKVGNIFTLNLDEGKRCSSDKKLLENFLANTSPVSAVSNEAKMREAAFGSLVSSLPDFKPMSQETIGKMNEGSRSYDEIRKGGARRFFSSSGVSFLNDLSQAGEPVTSSANNGKSTVAKLFGDVAATAASTNPEDGTQIYPGTVTASTTASATPTAMADQGKPSAEEVDLLDERSRIEEELVANRRELSQLKDKNAMDEMEKRIKSLEELLSKKDREYRKLLDERLDEAQSNGAKKKVANQAHNDGQSLEESSSHKSSFPHANAATGGSHAGADDGVSRGPASVPDSGGFAAASAGGAGLTAKAFGGRSSGSKINKALLEKYGIQVEGSTEASILVASDKEATSLGKVIDAHEGLNVPVVVSESQYQKFKINDLETLQEIYENKVKDLAGAVVKLSVTTQEKKEPLEFYAIREGDKVVFQPVRKNKLNDLRLALPKS